MLTLCCFVISCFPLETKNAEKAYNYWAGNKPPSTIRLLEGEYYQSPHFSLEYEVFLKFEFDEQWFYDFVEDNDLELDTVHNNWSQFTKLPEWFTVDNNFLIYAKDPYDVLESSRYFINPKNGICYIYETVGM